jgi:hypothetical protein
MTYTSGQLIQATDYNGFVSTSVGANINATWGQTATSTSGYGQGNVATVAAAGTVTATQWATLVNTVSSMANHQGTSITSRTAPVTGNTISILSNLNTDITSCFTNRNNAYARGTQYGTFTGNVSKTTTTGIGNAAWTITFVSTITWANNSAFNSFFNSGGMLKWETSKTADTTEADTEWNDLANTLVGDIFITGAAGSKTIANVAYTGTTKSGGTGTPTTLTTATGAYALTTTATTLYKQFADTAPYTGLYIQLNAAVNSNTVPTTMTLTTTWVDPGGAPVGSTDAISGGTAVTSPATAIGAATAPTTLVTYFPPESVYLTLNTWGTPTIAGTVT